MPDTWAIVLIDDEEDIREVMSIALADAGYEVRTAPDGETGIRLCVEAPPQIVITDIRMPGMGGLQVLERIKQQLPDTEVIVATAFGEMQLAIRALQLEASDFITQPIGSDKLFLALHRARERYTSRRRLKDYTLLLEREKAETSQQLLKTIAFQRNLIESSMDGILGNNEPPGSIRSRRLVYDPNVAAAAIARSNFFLPPMHAGFFRTFQPVYE